MNTRLLRGIFLVSLTCLLGTIFVLNWRFLFQGTVPGDGHIIFMGFPNWTFARSSFLQGAVPLWNPFRNLGEPFFADPQTMSLYPVLILLAGIGSFVRFLQLWVLVHTVIAALFTVLCVRRYTRDAAVIAAGAALVTLNSFFTAHVVFLNVFAAASWIPGLLYFQLRRSPIGTGITLALMWFAGYPPFFIIAGILLCAVALGQGKPGWVNLLRAALIFLGLSAVQLIPFLELVRNSSRGLVLNAASSTLYSLPPAQILKELFLVQWPRIRPDIAGDPAIVYFYAGPVPIVLSLIAVVRGKAVERWIGAGVLLSIVLSMGLYLPGYSRLTVLHLFRFPAHWLLATIAGIAVLSVRGMSRIPGKTARWAAAVIIIVDLTAVNVCPKSTWMLPRFFDDLPGLVSIMHREPATHRIYHSDQFMERGGALDVTRENNLLLLKECLLPSLGMAYGIREASSYQVLTTKRAQAFQKRLNEDGSMSPLVWAAGISRAVTLKPGAAAVEPGSVEVVTFRDPAPPLRTTSPADVRWRNYRPGGIEGDIFLKEPAAAVFYELYYPGWRVAVDGKRSRLFAYEDLFLAVNVPPGRHHVRFEYVPSTFLAGAILSLITAAGICLTLLKRRKRIAS